MFYKSKLMLEDVTSQDWERTLEEDWLRKEDLHRVESPEKDWTSEDV